MNKTKRGTEMVRKRKFLPIKWYIKKYDDNEEITKKG